MMTAQTTNGTVRVYLCQVGPNVSCGACCGLYNVAEPTPDALEALLVQRTRRFARVPRTIDGIDALKQTITQVESCTPPFPRFHHCPFLGLIEDSGQRVGCLLHPMANGNGGIDWRGLSYYGFQFCVGVRVSPCRENHRFHFTTACEPAEMIRSDASMIFPF